jgi:hypothetical protein
MQRDSSQYADAARLLWDLHPDRLHKLASGEVETTRSVRDAAQMALGAKREFLSPEDFGSQEAALERLGASLAMLPDFSLQEIAIASGHAPIRRTAPTSTVVASTHSRHRILRVALIVLTLLLGLEALARAGISVPSPIGIVVDRLGGDPDPGEALGGLRSRVDPEVDAPTSHSGALPDSAGAVTRRSGNSRSDLKAKNDRHARGRELHFARGREQHKAQGREVNKAEGSERERPAGSRARRVVRRSVEKARAVAARQVDRRGGNRGRGWRRSK